MVSSALHLAHCNKLEGVAGDLRGALNLFRLRSKGMCCFIDVFRVPDEKEQIQHSFEWIVDLMRDRCRKLANECQFFCSTRSRSARRPPSSCIFLAPSRDTVISQFTAMDLDAVRRPDM